MLSTVTMSAGALSSPGHKSSAQRTSNSASLAVEVMKSFLPCAGRWSELSFDSSWMTSVGMNPLSETYESTALIVSCSSPLESSTTRSKS